jgi:hypothetical protein
MLYRALKEIIFYSNIILLMINGLFLSINFVNKNSNKIYLKFSDIYNFNFIKSSYKVISDTLNKKYILNDFDNTKMENKTMFIKKKKIKLKNVGEVREIYNFEWLNKKLDNEFDIQYEGENPDYLIYNVFGDKDASISYKNCIRIAIYSENTMPDINYADYTIAHQHINYLDRYFKFPVFFFMNSNKIDKIEKIRKEVLKNPIRNKFCAAVISNKNSNFRLNFIEKISRYKKVDMGGKYKNNIGREIKNKIRFLKDYKFSLAMENSGGDGYVTEKIVDSFLAGNIPIYYGDFLIDEYINPKTYILIRGEMDIDEKIEYIKKIDNNDYLYREIMKEKPFVNNKVMSSVYSDEYKNFLKNIFRQDKEKAFRRDKSFYDYQCRNDN